MSLGKPARAVGSGLDPPCSWLTNQLGTTIKNRVQAAEKMVEAPGVEPGSEDASGLTSTRVGTSFKGLEHAGDDQSTCSTSQLFSISRRRRLERSSLIVSVLRGYRRKLRVPSLPNFS